MAHETPEHRERGAGFPGPGAVELDARAGLGDQSGGQLSLLHNEIAGVGESQRAIDFFPTTDISLFNW